MPAFTDTFAADMDLVQAAPSDWDKLVPKWARGVVASDAILVSGESYRVQSATARFHSAGLVPGHVVILEQTAGTPWRDVLAFVSAEPGGPPYRMTLAPVDLGGLAGSGIMPANPNAAMRLEVRTAYPALRRATRELLQRFGFSDVTAVTKPDDFRDLCVLLALIPMLWSAHRAGDDEENFHVKYKDLLAERDRLFVSLDAIYSNPIADPGYTPLIVTVDDPPWVPPPY